MRLCQIYHMIQSPSVLHDYLNMHSICARWVLRHHSDLQRLVKHAISRKLFYRNQQNSQNFVLRIITSDKSWLRYYDYKPTSKHGVGDSRWSSTGKILISTIWRKGFCNRVLWCARCYTNWLTTRRRHHQWTILRWFD